MTRFIHAHLHCIFSLLSQSLRNEVASLNPDKCSSARVKIPNLSCRRQSLGQVGRMLKDCAFVCHRFLLAEDNGETDYTSLGRQTRSVHGTEPELL